VVKIYFVPLNPSLDESVGISQPIRKALLFNAAANNTGTPFPQTHLTTIKTLRCPVMGNQERPQP